MRARADAARVRALARELARAAPGETTLYLTGGATAVLQGWRDSTLGVDIRLDPNSDKLLRRIATLKYELDVNVELASPPAARSGLPLPAHP